MTKNSPSGPVWSYFFGYLRLNQLFSVSFAFRSVFSISFVLMKLPVTYQEDMPPEGRGYLNNLEASRDIHHNLCCINFFFLSKTTFFLFWIKKLRQWKNKPGVNCLYLGFTVFVNSDHLNTVHLNTGFIWIPDFLVSGIQMTLHKNGNYTT